MRGVDLQHRNVGQRIAAQNPGRQLGAVRKGDHDPLGMRDHVIVGDDHPVRGDHEAGPGARHLLDLVAVTPAERLAERAVTQLRRQTVEHVGAMHRLGDRDVHHRRQHLVHQRSETGQRHGAGTRIRRRGGRAKRAAGRDGQGQNKRDGAERRHGRAGSFREGHGIWTRVQQETGDEGLFMRRRGGRGASGRSKARGRCPLDPRQGTVVPWTPRGVPCGWGWRGGRGAGRAAGQGRALLRPALPSRPARPAPAAPPPPARNHTNGSKGDALGGGPGGSAPWPCFSGYHAASGRSGQSCLG